MDILIGLGLDHFFSLPIYLSISPPVANVKGKGVEDEERRVGGELSFICRIPGMLYHMSFKGLCVCVCARLHLHDFIYLSTLPLFHMLDSSLCVCVCV